MSKLNNHPGIGIRELSSQERKEKYIQPNQGVGFGGWVLPGYTIIDESTKLTKDQIDFLQTEINNKLATLDREIFEQDHNSSINEAEVQRRGVISSKHTVSDLPPTMLDRIETVFSKDASDLQCIVRDLEEMLDILLPEQERAEKEPKGNGILIEEGKLGQILNISNINYQTKERFSKVINRLKKIV